MAASARLNQPVGREAELVEIAETLARAGAVVIEGEAGIGKTTIWRAAVEAARSVGAVVLAARPTQAERDLAFATLGDLLADVHEQFPELPPPQRRALEAALLIAEADGAPVEPRAVAAALLGVLATLSRHGPVAVAVDDVQWVDPSSAPVLTFALRRALLPVLLAQRKGTERHVDLECERIEVGPLSLGAVRELVHERFDLWLPRPLLRRIHERANGNPFYALELTRAIVRRGGEVSPQDPLPLSDDLERLVASRLGALPAKTRGELAAVAALGEPTFELVDERVLGPAIESGVLFVDNDRIRFDHPLLAAAAYDALTPSHRRALHRELATRATDQEEKVRHLALAADGPDSRLAGLLDEAAVKARARGAAAAAAELADRALRLTGEGGDAVALRTVTAAEYRAAAGDPDEARRLVNAALASQPSGRGRGWLLVQRGRLGEASIDHKIIWAREALAEAANDPVLEAAALDDLVMMTVGARRVADAEPYATRALELAERGGDPATLAHALQMQAWTQFALGQGLDDDLVERALDLDPQCAWTRTNLRPIVVCIHLFTFAGQLARARVALERAWTIARDVDDMTAQSLLGYAAGLEVFSDDLDRTAELLDELLRAGRATERVQSIVYALSCRVILAAMTGHEEEARRAFAEAISLDESYGSRFATRIGGWGMALLELSLDDPAAAFAYARAATNEPRGEGMQEPALLVAFADHAEAAIAVGELAEADELLDWIEDRALRVDRAWSLAQVARCRGLAAASRGDESLALAHFERARAEHARGEGRRFELARTLLAEGESLRRFKKKRAAGEALDEATSIFDALGATLWAAKARRERARIGGRTRSGDLTETEDRVMRLAASGRSNKEIAAELFVSVNTVETHLTRIYRKVGVRSRTELAARQSSGVSAISPPSPPS